MHRLGAMERATAVALACLAACNGPALDDFGCACNIGGKCHAEGVVDSHDPCHLCDPSFSPTSWAPAMGCVVTLVGNGTPGFRDGPASEAQLDSPEEIVIGPDGRLYIADSGNHRIRVVHRGEVATLAGSGEAGLADGPAASAKFNGPRGVALDESGRVYVTQSPQPAIRVVDGGLVSTIAGDGTKGFSDGAAQSARFHSPTSLAVDRAGQVYVADPADHRLRLIASGQVSTIAGDGTAGNTDGTLAESRFNAPFGLEVVSPGRFYVADKLNHRIRLVEPGGVTTVAGGAAGFQDGPVATALLQGPEAVTLDPTGAIVFSEVDNHSIRRLAGGEVITLAGDGTPGFADGLTENSRFSSPTGVAVWAGRIYVGDTNNHCVRVITPSIGARVESFTLINADTNQPAVGFDPMPSGATITISISALGTNRLNIRANTSPAAVGSVRFALDAQPDFRTENSMPYAMAGDDFGDYLAWTPGLGSHAVAATPYSLPKGLGNAGESASLTLDVNP